MLPISHTERLKQQLTKIPHKSTQLSSKQGAARGPPINGLPGSTSEAGEGMVTWGIGNLYGNTVGKAFQASGTEEGEP